MIHGNEKMFLSMAKAVFILSVILFSVLYSISFYYNPLDTDGGWYSYPALSLSRGGDPAENMMSVQAIDNQTTIRGLKAVFPFTTYKSIKILYTSRWFKYFSANIVSLKLLGLIELSLLFVLFYYLLNTNIINASVIYIFLSFFILDKSIVLTSSSDFRPDIIIAGLSIIIYLYINKPINCKNILIITAMIAASILIHVTAVIPLIFLLSFYMIKCIVNKEYNFKHSVSLMFYFGISFIVVLFYDDIMNFIFPTTINIDSSVSWVANRIGKRINQGIVFLFHKEFSRWKAYFLFSNIMNLLVLIVLFCQYTSRVVKRGLFKTENDIVFVGLVITAISMVIVDPHLTEKHIIPLIPFIMLFLAKEFECFENKNNKMIIYIVVIFSFINIVITGLISYRIFAKGNENKLNIHSIESGINKVFEGNNKRNKILAIGPAELWPYISIDSDIILIDNTRNKKNINSISGYVSKLDLLIINKDYRNYGWMDSFTQEYPNTNIIKTGVIGTGPNRIDIYSVSGS